MGGASSGMPHFSAAKRRWRAAWWGRGGVVATGYNLGTSRRLSLPWSHARGRAHGRGILRHALFLSREAALARGLVGTGRCGRYGIQSWDNPEVVPPEVTCVVRESLLGEASLRFFRNGRVARGCCAHSPIFDCSSRRRGVFGPRIVFAKGGMCFWVILSICGRLHFSRRRPSVRVGYRSQQEGSKRDAGGPAGSYSDRLASVMSRTTPRGDDCVFRGMPEEVGAPLCKWLEK